MDGGLALLENGSRNLDSALLQFLHDVRNNASGNELSGNLPSSQPAPLETKDVLQLGRRAFHSDDLGDALHTTNAVFEPPNVND
jgi:hypothetical protein